jgi:ABC-type spermidine/putrescine transport system permease subunit II
MPAGPANALAAFMLSLALSIDDDIITSFVAAMCAPSPARCSTPLG